MAKTKVGKRAKCKIIQERAEGRSKARAARRRVKASEDGERQARMAQGKRHR